MRCETVGYGFTPTVERRRLLGGLIPSRSAQGAEVLVYHLFRTDPARGTVITVACPRDLAEEAIGRFRALTEPGYRAPATSGACVHKLLGTLLHEAAHRVGHRGGGRWIPVPDYGDRTRGFEDLLSEFAALLLGYLTDGGTLPDPVHPPERAPAARGRRSRADDPAVPLNQYRLTLVRRRSRPTASSGSAAAGSVHSLNFSTIQASWPTGESVSP